jgi:hypothetical protein
VPDPSRSAPDTPLRPGRQLFVNADVAAGGELRVAVLDERGDAYPPLALERCLPIRENGTRLRVRWRGEETLPRLAGRPVRLRFRLTRGRLYAFWPSPSRRGASHGFVAAGGPGLAGDTDREGGAL